MYDLLGRKVHQGDLVIKSSSNRSSSQLNIGVFTGKSIMCMELAKDGCKESFKVITRVENFYIVENPTNLDMEVKNKILEFIQSKKSDAEKRHF